VRKIETRNIHTRADKLLEVFNTLGCRADSTDNVSLLRGHNSSLKLRDKKHAGEAVEKSIP